MVGQLISNPESARVVTLLPTVIAKKSIAMWTMFCLDDSIFGAWPAISSIKTMLVTMCLLITARDRPSIARDLYLAKVANCLKTPTKSSDENTRV